VKPPLLVFSSIRAGRVHRRRSVNVVDWFRRRAANGRPPGNLRETEKLDVSTETAEELVDRGPQPEEPADGLSEAGIREALRDVRDPEIGRDLVSLNMIRNVDIEGSGVTIGVALTTAGCPMKHRITTDVRDRLMEIEGVQSVEVDFGVMTDDDRQNLMTSLHGGPSELAPAFRDESKTRIIAVVSAREASARAPWPSTSRRRSTGRASPWRSWTPTSTAPPSPSC
jgi:metal-sulfur cluster biosynthetic enzyme